MKRKYFLRGTGVGILVATVILVTAYAVSGDKSMTNEEIMQRAEALGMVTTESVLEQKKTTEATSATATEAPTTEAASTEEASSEESETEATTEATTAEATEATTAESTTEASMAKKKVTFTIVSGMDSYDVCKLLNDQGVVDDALAFDDYLVKNGYANRISTGEYTVEKGEDYETIAKRLTNSQ